MRIRTKLLIQSILPIGLALTAIILHQTTARKMDVVSVNMRVAHEVARELLHLHHAAIQHLDEASGTLPHRWIESHAQLVELLSRLSVFRPHDQVLLRDIGRQVEGLPPLFERALRGDPVGEGTAFGSEPERQRASIAPFSTAIHAITFNVLTLAAVNQEYAFMIQAQARMTVIAMIALMAIVILLSSTVIGGSINQGIASLLSAIHGMRDGQLSQRAGLQTRDEMQELGDAFDSMSQRVSAANAELAESLRQREALAQRLRESNVQLSDSLIRLKRAQAEIVQQERMRALKQISRGLIHDINDALMPVHTVSEFIRDNPDSVCQNPARLKDFMAGIHKGSTKLAAITRTLSAYFYEATTESPSPVEVMPFVRDVVDHCLALHMGRGPDQATISIDVSSSGPGELVTYPQALRDALVPVVMNACEALDQGGNIDVRCTYEKEQLVIAVQDRGLGIDPSLIVRCHEPFFSTKGQGHSGLGLAMAQSAVKRAKGALDIQSAPGAGTTVLISLAANRAEGALETATPAADGETLSLHILVVDDEAWITKSVQMVLDKAGFITRTASSGSEAMDRIREESFDAIILDRAMPDMTGDEIAAFLHKNKPAVPVVMLTGYGDFMVESGELPVGVTRVLSKPVSASEIVDIIVDVCRRGKVS